MKLWLTRILLTFVIFSLGYGVGREVALSRKATDGNAGASVMPGRDKVVVFYMHTTFRCVTCNEIERMTKAVVETDFAAALAAGRIEWQEVNFQERKDLAKKYDIASSCVVVVSIKNGQEAGFQRLDEVWPLSDKPAQFAEFVGSVIRKYLDGPAEDK